MAGILQIGANVNIAELKAGMEDAAGTVRSQAGAMSSSFEGLAAESRASTEEIASNWVKVAQASLTLRSAQSDVRSATQAAREAEEGDTAALARLALAKREATIASQAQTAAIKAATVGVVEEEGALAGLTERLIGSAEAAKLTEGSMAGFAGLAGILGGGLLVGFFAHMEDEVAKSVVELDHLSAKTGISIQALAGLKQIVAELGGEFEPVQQGLVRMEKAQQMAVEGNKATVEAFQRIGISVKELESLTPEQLLYRIAQGIQDTGSHAAVAASSIAIFGKGGAALIPIFKDAGSSLQSMIEKAGAASGISEESARAAREWTKDLADLSQMARALATEVLSPLLTIIKALGFGFEVLGGVTATVARTLVQPFFAAAEGARDLAKTLQDTIHGDVAAVQRDVEQMKANWTASWKSSTDDIEGYWARLKATRDSLFFAPPPKREKTEDLDVPTPARAGAEKDNVYDIEVKQQEAHELAMLEIERKGYEEEAKLRGDSALQIEAQMLAFNDRELRIKQNAIAELRGLQGEKNDADRQANLAGEEQAAEDRAALQRVEINARANNQIVQDGKARTAALEGLLKSLTETDQKETAARSEQARKELEERERTLREEASFAREMNEQTLEFALKTDDDRLKHGQLNAKQWADLEIAAVNQWKDKAVELLEAEAQQEQAINGRQTVEYQRIKNQEVLIAQQAADRIAEIQQKEEDKYLQLYRSFANTTMTALNNILEGHKKLSQNLIQLWNGLVMDLVKFAEQWVIEWGAAELKKLLLDRVFGVQSTTLNQANETARVAQHTAANAQIQAQDLIAEQAQVTMADATQTELALVQAGGLATREATQGAANEAMAISDSSLAAVAAFASVIEALPFPANVAAAPGVAAATFAEAMAFGSVAAFETGGIIPRTGFVLGHEKEAILPAPLTGMLTDVANRGGVTQAGARAGHTFNVNYQPVINHPLTRDDLREHAEFMFGEMRRLSNAFNQ